MIWVDLIFGAYVAVALFGMHMTLQEAGAKETGGLAERVLGCLACALWPLTFAAVAIWCRLSRPVIALR